MAGRGGGVLLVVDEDRERAQRVEELIAAEGVTVLHAKSVAQGVELLQALGQACCVLISMTLPMRGAWELLSRLRSDRLPESACAVILYGPQSVLDPEPRNAPVIAKLPTPIDVFALRDLVREHCVPDAEPSKRRSIAGRR